MAKPHLVVYSPAAIIAVKKFADLHNDLHTALTKAVFVDPKTMKEIPNIPKADPFIIRITPPAFSPQNLRPQYKRGGDDSSLRFGIAVYDENDLANVIPKTPSAAGKPDQVPVRQRGKLRKLPGTQDFLFQSLTAAGFKFTPKVAGAMGENVLIYVHSFHRFFDTDIKAAKAVVAVLAVKAV